VGLSLKAKSFFDVCKEMAQVFRDNQILLLRPSNSLQYREGHEVFSVVTGGRPLSFSQLISGRSRSSPDLSGENAEGAKNPLLISRRKDPAHRESLGTEEKTSLPS